MQIDLSDAVEVVTGGDGGARVLLTCEHASERLPEPWEWPLPDRRLVGTHWAYDIGASDLTRELADRLGAIAVLARFSRLLVDPNRPLGDPTLFRERADDAPVAMNQALDDLERRRRIERLYDPYHGEVDAHARRSGAPVLLAVHTFTPLYEGAVRELEVGVLFDRDEALALEVRDAVARTGLSVALNEPYSGREGLMYSVDRHATALGRRSVEIEVRQDLAVEAVARHKLVDALESVLARGR